MLDLLVVIVRLSVIPWDVLSFMDATTLIGIGPRFDVTLKFSMPVICIFIVLGFPAIKTWPLLPLIAEPLFPELVDVGPCFEGAGVRSLHVYSYIVYLQIRFVSSFVDQPQARSINSVSRCFQTFDRKRWLSTGMSKSVFGQVQ